MQFTDHAKLLCGLVQAVKGEDKFVDKVSLFNEDPMGH